MIDYFMKYADEATAKTALASRLTSDGGWPLDLCIPGVQFWRVSQDNGDGSHNYLPGFFIVVSLPTIVPALRDLGSVQVVIDREKAKARQSGAVIKSNVSNAILQDLMFSPVPAGADFPYGNMI